MIYITGGNENKAVGILNYDETARAYTIDIPDGVFSGEVPFMLSLFLKKGDCRLAAPGECIFCVVSIRLHVISFSETIVIFG